MLDLYLYAFDGSLGFQPSFWMGRLVSGSAAIQELLQVSYTCLPLMIGLVCAGHLGRGSSGRVLGALASAGVLGYITYFLFPASGPLYFLAGRFPSAPHTLAELRALPLRPLEWAELSPRNAMPSLHATGALLLWLNCRPFSLFYRSLAFLFVLVTLITTLSLGEHYLIDLVVAIPFAVAVQLLWTKASPRQKSIGAAVTLGLTASWIAILRYDVRMFFVSPVVPWTCAVVSTVLSWLVARRISDSMV